MMFVAASTSSPQRPFPYAGTNMATELNPDGWDGGEPVVEDTGAAEGWGEAEVDAPLAVEDTGISDVQLFNKW